MKKLLSLFVVTAVVCIAVSADSTSDDRFINALRNCSTYNESGTTNSNNMQIQSQKQISGWENNKCRYTESLNLNSTNIKVSCSFTKPQIDEIVSVADAYFLTLKYSKEEPDLSSAEAVQNNPITQVFGKYIQDSSVCLIEGMQ